MAQHQELMNLAEASRRGNFSHFIQDSSLSYEHGLRTSNAVRKRPIRVKQERALSDGHHNSCYITFSSSNQYSDVYWLRFIL